MSLGEPSFSSIQLIKDRGNYLFKKGIIPLASSLYKQALNFLCYVAFMPSGDAQATSSLALSLVLNLAACELKLSHYDMATRYCKFVLHFDPANVKALYRKALACKHLNFLNDALNDFEHVLHLDPTNSEASRELLDVVDRLAVNPNGKRVALPFDPLSSSNKGKKPILSVDAVDQTIVASSSTSCCSDQMATEVNSLTEASEPSSFLDHMVFDTEPDLIPGSEDTDSSIHSFTERLEMYCFSKKQQATKQMHISSKDYENLLRGKDLSYFHAGSLSFMRVRPLIPENSIQMGTPHEDISRAAEVPPSTPLPKEEILHLTLILENTTMVREDIVFQIDKTKRVSPDTAQVSRISEVEFQCIAVKGSMAKSKSCRRKMDFSLRRGRVMQASVHLKKRSSFSVENPYSLCKSADAIRAKRKEVDRFHFEDFYHPPTKKCRLTVSSSFFVTFRSVTWFSSTLRDSGTWGFAP